MSRVIDTTRYDFESATKLLRCGGGISVLQFPLSCSRPVHSLEGDNPIMDFRVTQDSYSGSAHGLEPRGSTRMGVPACLVSSRRFRSQWLESMRGWSKLRQSSQVRGVGEKQRFIKRGRKMQQSNDAAFALL